MLPAAFPFALKGGEGRHRSRSQWFPPLLRARIGVYRCLLALAATLAISVPEARAADAGPVAALDADPEDGAVHDGVYQNGYFGLTVPLPPGWTKGFDGPAPSQTGYYVLANFTPAEALTATMLIAAQDQFFAAKPAANAAEAVDRFAATLGGESGLTLVQAPHEILIAGRSFTRLDYEGAGLRHVLLATDRRCHIVSMVLTTRDSGALEELVRGLQAMRWTGDGDDPLPLCLKDYPEAESRAHALGAAWGAGGASIPARLVIGADGKVRHVHVIGAPTPVAEMLSVVLAGWTFAPDQQGGRPIAIETGVVIGSRR